MNSTRAILAWVRPCGFAFALCGAACAPREAVRDAREPSNAPTETRARHDPPPARAEVFEGYATWYGAELAGHLTANGERFDPRGMTAAHRSLPFNTWVEVTRVDTGARVRVRITDRGPFGHAERIIDLSRAAAAKLHMLGRGTAPVTVRVLDGP